MVYCSSCGNQQSESTKYCTECGHNLQGTSQGTTSGSSQSTQQTTGKGYDEGSLYRDYGKPEKRSFWNYGIFPVISIALSIIGGAIFAFLGLTMRFNPDSFPVPIFLIPIFFIFSSIASIVYIYYIYLNFEDLRKLQTMSHERPYPEPMEPVIPLIAMFIFAPISFYFKYDHLYKHLKEQHEQTHNLSPSPMKLVLSWVVMFIAPFLVVPVILFSQMILVGIVFVILTFIGIGLYVINLESQWQKALNNHIDHHM